MPTKEIDVIFNQKSAGNGGKQTISTLQAIEQQANRTREKMEKLANVGNKMALIGGAIVAPFALAMKKYVDTAKDTERTSKRLVALNQKWEESQVRLGRVTATIVLPYLERAASILDQVISFAEKNPGVVQAALSIGTTLVILGGIISTTAQLVSTIATIQGLAASAGIALSGGGAAAGAGAALSGAGLTAAITAGFTAAIPFLLTGLAVWAAGELTLSIMNAILGTNQTWADLLETLRILVRITEDGFVNLGSNIMNTIRGTVGNTGAAIIAGIYNGVKSLFLPLGYITLAINSLRSLFGGKKSAGGYMSKPAFYAGAEDGRREFVLNAATTRNAERAIGGRLTQGAAASYMTNNINLATGQTVVQGRRQTRQNQQQIAGAVFSLVGA